MNPLRKDVHALLRPEVPVWESPLGESPSRHAFSEACKGPRLDDVTTQSGTSRQVHAPRRKRH
jgi:hypothetical protein